VNTETKRNIRGFSQSELLEILQNEFGEKKFRTEQIYQWIWAKNATKFSLMANIPKSLQEKLDEKFYFNEIKIKVSQKSVDGSMKVAFELFDGKIVEGVLIPSSDRITACVSSQTGCNLSCAFCATGKIKNPRNLLFEEIFDQIFVINELSQKEFGKKLSNIVYMGMGEPLLNYENVLKSIEKVTWEKGLAFSPYRITVSTVGISRMIRRLADENIKFNLAISLHSANEKIRNKIMPYSQSDDLQNLSEAIRYYHKKTGDRITYEYILFKNVNDTLQDVKELAEFCKISTCKINIIEYNKVDDSGFEKSNNQNTEVFVNFLKSCNLIVNIRRSKGSDIDAACGQLANK
jgi:23S rRNA (adenine2503-C2)-methyltransferase